jgi:hypothetical protein
MSRIAFKEYSDADRHERIAQAYHRLHIISIDTIIVTGIECLQNGDGGDKWISSASGASHPLREGELATPSGAVRAEDPD